MYSKSFVLVFFSLIPIGSHFIIGNLWESLRKEIVFYASRRRISNFSHCLKECKALSREGLRIFLHLVEGNISYYRRRTLHKYFRLIILILLFNSSLLNPILFYKDFKAISPMGVVFLPFPSKVSVYFRYFYFPWVLNIYLRRLLNLNSGSCLCLVIRRVF